MSSEWPFEQTDNFLNRPDVIRETSFHRGCDAERLTGPAGSVGPIPPEGQSQSDRGIAPLSGGTPADDAREPGVDPNLVPRGALPHRPRDAQPTQRQNAPRIR